MNSKMTTNIALDTNIWIYLTKDTFFELWLKFKEMKEREEIQVIVTDITLIEWARNKPKTLSSLTESIKADYISATNLAKYLSGESKENYLRTISNYKEEAKRLASAKAKVDEIETFMKSCSVIETTQEQKLFIANCAINKFPPFQNNKNNFNDALILRSTYEYVNRQFPQKFDLIYVSNNPDDFIDKQTAKVHESIFSGLEPIEIKNVRELGEALRLAPELIDEFDEWLDAQLDSQAMHQLDMMRGK